MAADVLWEQADRAPQTLFFELNGSWAQCLQPQPEAFALACLPYAFWCGEQRLWIDAALCPRLREGLKRLSQIWIAQRKRLHPLVIEAADGWHPPPRAQKESTAAFLSGGVDALSTLQGNRLDFPLSHPGAITTCLFLYGTNGMQMGPEGPDPERFHFYGLHLKRLQSLAEEEHFRLLSILTNVRFLAPSYACWTRIGYGPATVAAAHLLTGRITRVLFASDGHAMEALEVPLFSSAALDVLIDQAGVSREQKLSQLARWPAGLELIQPCHLVTLPKGGVLNCGRCEKCLRTKLILHTLGLPISPRTFEDLQIRPQSLLLMPLVSEGKIQMFRPLILPLFRRGDVVLGLMLALRLLVAKVRVAIAPPRW